MLSTHLRMKLLCDSIIYKPDCMRRLDMIFLFARAECACCHVVSLGALACVLPVPMVKQPWLDSDQNEAAFQITPSFKLKRPQLKKQFAKEVEQMYKALGQ